MGSDDEVLALSLIAFLAAQLGLLGAWWTCARAFGEELSFSERLVCTGILGLGHIVLCALLLGAFGLMSDALFISVLLLSGAGLYLFARRRGAPAEAALSIRPLLSFATAGLCALLALVLTLTVWRGVIAAPLTWDACSYHLPMAVLMKQRESLDLQLLDPAMLGGSSTAAQGWVHLLLIDSYPKNLEIWTRWLLAFFTDDSAVDLAQLPFLVLGQIAIFALARRLGSSPVASFLAALIYPFTPVVLCQITTAYTDMGMSALILSSLALLFALRAAQSRFTLLAFGCALGLLAGAKFSGPVLAAVFVLAHLASGLRHPKLRPQLARHLAVMLVLISVLGAYAFVHNSMEHANPVYPYRYSIAGLIDLPGPIDPTTRHGMIARQVRGAAARALKGHELTIKSWLDVTKVHHSGLSGGFGLTWPFLLLLCLVSIGIAVKARQDSRLALFALVTLLFLLTPMRWRPRFVIYLVGLGAIALAHVFDALAARRRLQVALSIAVVLIAGATFAQVWPARYRPLLDEPSRSRLAERCPKKSYVGGFRWLRTHARADQTVTVFRGGSYILPYNLFNRELTNRIAVPLVHSWTDFVSHLDEHALVFLPHDSKAYAAFRGQDARSLVPVYEDREVSIVALRPK